VQKFFRLPFIRSAPFWRACTCIKDWGHLDLVAPREVAVLFTRIVVVNKETLMKPVKICFLLFQTDRAQPRLSHWEIHDLFSLRRSD
jgi:hypothetical protein